MKNIKTTFIIVFLCGFSYLVGALTVYNKWKVFRMASYYKHSLLDKFQDNKYSFENYFVNDLIDNDGLIYPEIKTMKELKNYLDHLNIGADIDSAYTKIKILSINKQDKILKINYKIDSYVDSLYAYHKTKFYDQKSFNGILIIPGSGINQSTNIYFDNDPVDHYQSNIDDILADFGDRYIFIKPNEDILAYHNGKRKIDENVFVNYLLNKGGSFSKHYLIQTIALKKYLEENYKTVTVVGLSQGGLAAMINSLKTEPDFAIISSGYSVLMDYPYNSNHRQIIIPGLKKKFKSDTIKRILEKQKTKYLFTYGKLESGIYGAESNNQTSEKFFGNKRNLHFEYHPKGHIFPEKEILDFCRHLKINNGSLIH